MKRLIFITLSLFILASTFAQRANLAGRILDNDNNPLPGASVLVNGTYLGTSTNNNGNYKFDNLSSGEYTISVSFIGYQSATKTVEISKDTELNIALEPATYVSNEILVTAIRANSSTPVAQTNISKSEIAKQNNSADIPFQLELTPSVVATSENGTGNGYTNMRIRGTDISRINITVNGIPLNDPESQGVFFVNMADFTSSIDNIQIQRGVGTSSNGAASFGASINFQTLDIEKKPYAKLSSSVGSFNTFKRSISAGTGLINDKFAFDMRYSKLNSDGWIQRGFSDHESMYMSGSYSDEKNLLKAVILMGNERTGITWWGVPDYMIDSVRNFNPAGEYTDKDGNQRFYDGQTDNYWQNHYQLLYTREISKSLNFNAALHTTTGKGYYEQYKAGDDFADYGLHNVQFNDNAVYSSDIIRQKWLDNIFYGYTATVNYRKGKLDAAFGTAANKYVGDHFGQIIWSDFNNSIPKDYVWYKNTGTKTDINAFAKAQYRITEHIAAYGDIQYRNIIYDMSGPDDDLVEIDQEHNWDFVNPKAGVTYKIDNSNSTFLSFAIANREPTRADLKESVKAGGEQVPTFETLYDYEFGYLHKKVKYTIAANIYYMDYDNQLVQTGELNSVGYSIMTNVKESYRRGLELSFGYRPIKQLEWTGNITYSQNRIQNYTETAAHYDTLWAESYDTVSLGETHISYSPEIIASSVITYSPIKNLGLSLITKYVGEQYFDNTSSENRKLDAYLLQNFRIDYSCKFKGLTTINVQFLVNNLLDIDYISNAYGGNWYEQGTEKTWAYYFPQAGRNYMVKLSLDF